MLTFKERDDVTIQNPPADEVVLFYTDGALRLKDETGEVSTLATTEGLEAVAEATEPKVYVALLSQTGTDDPTAVVLKNTLGGEVVWTRENTGLYYGTLLGAFPQFKTVIYFQTGLNYALTGELESVWGTSNHIVVTREGVDGFDRSIKIEVYP